jgi:uncharacterized protein (TIGR02597 family)
MQRANMQRGLRFLPIVGFITTVGLISASMSNQASAQNVYTDPVGFITLNVQGGSAAYSFLGLGMTQVPVLRGATTTITGTQVTLGQTLTPGQYNPANTVGAATDPSYFIEFTSGPNAGLLDDIVSNDAAAVYTATDDSSMESGGVTFKIYPHWTIGQVFGPSNSAGLGGATSASAADNILVWNPNTQGPATYYFKTGGLGGTGWRSTASTSINTSNSVLYIDQGFQIFRHVSTNVTVQLVGGVKLSNTLSVVVGSGYTFAGNVEAAGIPIGTSGLYTGNNTTGLNGGTSASAADNVLIWNPATQGSATYYFKTGGLGGSGWRSTASTSVDASTNQIPLGAFAEIQRKISGAFTWTIPNQY